MFDVMLDVILKAFYFLVTFSCLDLLIHKRTDVIDNLAFIIPLILIKTLYNHFYPIEWVGYFVSLVGTALLYGFILLPYIKRVFQNKLVWKIGGKGISKKSTSDDVPKICNIDIQNDFISHHAGSATSVCAMSDLWPIHVMKENATPFKLACDLMEELHKTADRVSSLKMTLKKHLQENNISRSSVKEYLSKQKKRDKK